MTEYQLLKNSHPGDYPYPDEPSGEISKETRQQRESERAHDPR
jgi:hypothetical protein